MGKIYFSITLRNRKRSFYGAWGNSIFTKKYFSGTCIPEPSKEKSWYFSFFSYSITFLNVLYCQANRCVTKKTMSGYCMIYLQSLLNATKRNQRTLKNLVVEQTSNPNFIKQSNQISFHFISFSSQFKSKAFNVKQLEILELKIVNFLALLKQELSTRLTVHKRASFESYSNDIHIHPSPAFKLNKVRKKKAPFSLCSTVETSIT